jgi:hypothetical protein
MVNAPLTYSNLQFLWLKYWYSLSTFQSPVDVETKFSNATNLFQILMGYPFLTSISSSFFTISPYQYFVCLFAHWQSLPNFCNELIVVSSSEKWDIKNTEFYTPSIMGTRVRYWQWCRALCHHYKVIKFYFLVFIHWWEIQTLTQEWVIFYTVVYTQYECTLVRRVDRLCLKSIITCSIRLCVLSPGEVQMYLWRQWSSGM